MTTLKLIFNTLGQNELTVAQVCQSGEKQKYRLNFFSLGTKANLRQRLWNGQAGNNIHNSPNKPTNPFLPPDL